jgi:2-polyprenyl-3-methyl-5-hydroxy-6-metoxy-1,4-benzoquinol methylase
MNKFNDFKRFTETDIRPEEFNDEHKKAVIEDITMLQKRKDEFVRSNCPACNFDDSTNEFLKNEFSYKKCNHCQTIYTNPRPSPEILKWFYKNSKNYDFWNNVMYPASEESRKKNIIIPRVNKTIELCHKYGNEMRSLLEVGAGFGSFCLEIKSTKKFKHVVAIEPTPELATTCRKKKIETIESPIEDIDFSSKKFDVVVNFEVIEHLFAPKEFLLQIKNILNDDGLLILSCPNGMGFDIRILKDKSHTIDHEHLNYFNPYSMSLLLRECGYEVLDVFTPGKLDAELVRKKILSGDFVLDRKDDFIKHVLIDKWEEIGDDFQQFLVNNVMSSNMWAVAQKS